MLHLLFMTTSSSFSSACLAPSGTVALTSAIQNSTATSRACILIHTLQQGESFSFVISRKFPHTSTNKTIRRQTPISPAYSMVSGLTGGGSIIHHTEPLMQCVLYHEDSLISHMDSFVLLQCLINDVDLQH